MLDRAIVFATEAHKGQKRKGSKIPYIMHPLEAATIVASMTTDENIIIAALLHDTMEDCNVTYEQIKCKFGQRVADLVRMETEDKSKSWLERKSATIERVTNATDYGIKMIALGDKLSNIRSLERDYNAVGDDLWSRFRQKDPSIIAWYYQKMRDGVSELIDTFAYKEYDMLVDRFFEVQLHKSSYLHM